MAYLIDSSTIGATQESQASANDLGLIPPHSSSGIFMPNEQEAPAAPLLDTTTEEPLVALTPSSAIDLLSSLERSSDVLPPSRYLDPESGSITAVFSRELASFYSALLRPVSPAAQLFLQQSLVATGDLIPLGRMALEDMSQVRNVLVEYTPAVPEFFPLYAARVVVARAFGDQDALRQAALEGAPVMLHAFQLLATAPRFSLLTLQQLAAYASPVAAALGEIRQHEMRLNLLTAAKLLYCNARTEGSAETAMAECGRYSACRMAVLSALHLDRHAEALTLLGTLSDEPLELDTPRQVLTAIALAQSGQIHEAIETAKYFALLPEVMGPLGFDHYADVDEVPHPEVLGQIDLDNPEDGYQYEFVDMRLFPAAAHLFQFVRQTLKDTGFDPNDPFTTDAAARRATAHLSCYFGASVASSVSGEMLH